MSKEERVVEGKATEDSHGVKRPLPVGVHSPNDWEHADLGNDQRKNKFLKLMGAGKKEHHGRIVIGEKAELKPRTRSEEENREVRDNLLEQYNQSLESKMTGASRRHVGFGFSDPSDKKQEESAARPEPEGCDNSLGTSTDSTAKCDLNQCDTETDNDKADSSTPLPGFVKSSS